MADILPPASDSIRDGVLYHEHLVLYREGEQPAG
jgi:hypothetical protein